MQNKRQRRRAPENANAPEMKITDREEVHVKNLECQYSDDVSSWFSLVKQWYKGPDPGAQSGAAPAAASAAADAAPAAALPSGDQSGDQASISGPKGPGWIVKLEGYHFHNDMEKYPYDSGAQFIRRTLLDNLLNMEVELPNKDRDGKDIMEKVSMQDVGITYPVLVNPRGVEEQEIDNPMAGESGGAKGESPSKIRVPRFDFTVQFCWQPKSPSERREEKKKEAEKAPPTTGGEQAPAQP